MGAWYLFNALGLYPLSPASGEYVLGSPLFANVTLDVGAAQPLVISAINQAPNNVYVAGATWNGAAISGVSVKYSELMAGGVLQVRACAGVRGIAWLVRAAGLRILAMGGIRLDERA